MMEPRTVLLDDEDERRRRRRLGRLKRVWLRAFMGAGDPIAAAAEDYMVDDVSGELVSDDVSGELVISGGA